MSFFPEMDHYNVGPEGYLEHIAKLKKAVNIPIIASLNGVSSGGWVDYAKRMQEAGADALELNFYYIPTSFKPHSGRTGKGLCATGSQYPGRDRHSTGSEIEPVLHGAAALRDGSGQSRSKWTGAFQPLHPARPEY